MPQQEVPQRELPARNLCQELQRGALARSRRERCQPHGASAALPCPARPRRGAAARPQRPAHRARPDGAGCSSRLPPRVASSRGSSPPRSRASTGRPSPPPRGARRRRGESQRPRPQPCPPLSRQPAAAGPGALRSLPQWEGTGRAGSCLLTSPEFARVSHSPRGPPRLRVLQEGGREGNEGRGGGRGKACLAGAAAAAAAAAARGRSEI